MVQTRRIFLQGQQQSNWKFYLNIARFWGVLAFLAQAIVLNCHHGVYQFQDLLQSVCAVTAEHLQYHMLKRVTVQSKFISVVSLN